MARHALHVQLIAQGAPGGLGRAEHLLHDAFVELAEYGRVTVSTATKRTHANRFSQPGSPEVWSAGGSKLRLIYHTLRLAATRRPDVMVLSHVNLAPIGLLAKRLRLTTRLVTVVHGIEAWQPLPPAKRLAVRGSDAVWAPSEYTRQMLHRASGVSLPSIKLLPWALSARSCAPRVEGPAEPSGPGCVAFTGAAGGRFDLLTVTRLEASERYKGVAEVLRCLPALSRAVPDVSYAVVGDGTDRAALQGLASELGLDGRVRFLGAVNDEALVRAYQNCEVFTLPSRGEGFGLVFLEAMAAGKPVVAARAGATPEVVLDGETGLLVDFGDVPALAGALASLLLDRARRQQMGEAGRRRVAEQFRFEHFVERVDGLLAELL